MRRVGAYLWLLAVCGLAAILTACADPSPGVGGGAVPPRSVPGGSRVPIVLVPGVSREVSRVLRGGPLVPFSTLALRTDPEALAAFGDPRFPADGTPADVMPARLDKALRGTAVRGLQPLVERLVRDEGYVRGDPTAPADKDYPENPPEVRAERSQAASLFVLYYDWRRDMAESACILADRVARIREATGSDRVLLVGHSLGGVLARYYIRYGGRDAIRDRDCALSPGTRATAINAPGSRVVARAVFLGAPQRGSVQAFRALLEDFSLFGVFSIGLREAVFTMPLSWQLLPVAEADGSVPLIVDATREERVSLYVARTWAERGWIEGSHRHPELIGVVERMLARASAFQTLMKRPYPEEEAVERLSVAGDCRPTPARAIQGDGKLEFLGWGQTSHPLQDRATAPGDGVVTAESALGLPASRTLRSLSTCSRHSGYLEDSRLLDRVTDFLLR